MTGKRTYEAMIGTGGIGTGTFFALSGNHTLGREESRGGKFLNRRDYCKLHIISHYVQRLVGFDFKTLPVGKVGDDTAGLRLMEEMRAEGLDLSLTSMMLGEQTLDCICLLYPDGSGGNLTVTDSASGQVTANDIKVAGPWFEKYASRGIALAVPEVPMAARLELLDMAGKFDFFRAASFSSEEMTDVRESGLLSQVDLLAINFHEAASLAGCNVEGAPQEIIKWIADNLGCKFPHLKLSITNGSTGSWIINGGQVIFLAAPKVEVQSAAGAGDAHFSGILAGLAAGLSIAEAHWIGILAGAMSVTSPHTIHPGIDRPTLRKFAARHGFELPTAVCNFLN